MDLSDAHRDYVERTVSELCRRLLAEGQSLAIAREAMINAFDEAASDVAAG